MKRILVTGGAGFIGTNLCKRLVDEGHDVSVLDNLSSSKKFPDCIPSVANGRKLWKCWERDVKNLPTTWFANGNHKPFDQIYHLACPASPPQYQKDPVDTLMTNVVGTDQILRYASFHGSRVLLTSTSEVYGEPQVSPQPESYRGNVNSIGIRSCYDEGKRAAESLMYDYHREHGVDIRVARIFNTFGPHMDLDDGRVVTNFIRQILSNEPVTVYGTGEQTRSFCYVDDMVEGLIRLMNSEYTDPVNLGNPEEITINQLVNELYFLMGGNVKIQEVDLPADDPTNRRPDISVAKRELGWRPLISRMEGLQKTIEYAKLELGVE